MAPILDERDVELISHSADQTQRIGAHLGELAQRGDLFCLEGELGAGKTCLCQGIGQGMGLRDRIVSPTFTLVNEYSHGSAPLLLYHLDLYRLDDIDELVNVGWDEYLYGGQVCIIEWADKIERWLPPDRLKITLTYIDTDKRGILLQARGERHQTLLRAFRKRALGIRSP